MIIENASPPNSPYIVPENSGPEIISGELEVNFVTAGSLRYGVISGRDGNTVFCLHGLITHSFVFCKLTAPFF